ncbi:hypothetical protein [Desulfobacula toluolica]|uniref:Uncharacterized protein n=1 Tax=Desulfobacula toluolica (strain DSM 7467 / Tol2) TaxID=651182 RepID=K0N3V1_DESTT|nr:hypothetical protein [Desulfobacula toluolica]CCK78794.1 uncharacterized protein TOL2_C06250 [Desulfobacula toluolica Tol2]
MNIFLFTRIQNENDALKTIKDSSMVFFFLIVLSVYQDAQSIILFYVRIPSLAIAFEECHLKLVIRHFIIYTISTIMLLKWKSRVTAILLFLLSLSSLVNTGCYSYIYIIWIIIQVIVFWAAIRAVEATFKLHGKFTAKIHKKHSDYHHKNKNIEKPYTDIKIQTIILSITGIISFLIIIFPPVIYPSKGDKGYAFILREYATVNTKLLLVQIIVCILLGSICYLILIFKDSKKKLWNANFSFTIGNLIQNKLPNLLKIFIKFFIILFVFIFDCILRAYMREEDITFIIPEIILAFGPLVIIIVVWKYFLPLEEKGFIPTKVQKRDL